MSTRIQFALNQKIADQLHEIADLLEQQDANPFRVNAFRRAADSIKTLNKDIQVLVERGGADKLLALPNIGTGIARIIYEIVATGGSSRLHSLRGTLEPESLFQSVPGIGPELAGRIHDHLQVQTLESLEMAAHDGSLESVPGVGRRRAAVIRASLATMLGRRTWHRSDQSLSKPSVALLLEVDAEYRQKAEAARLPTIAPRRFNPEGKAWLPILHSRRKDWHFSVLFSNTALAHKLHRTHDWVVLFHYDDHHHEGQHTIVTETRGPLIGRRVVRGRESECIEYYGKS